ncbi:MAG: GNAT family N-acetyltransferase [Fimbriimonadaceae bacterium]
MPVFEIREARPADVDTLMALIGDLAEYERLSDQFVGTAKQLHDSLFAEDRTAYALLAFEDDVPVGYAIYFFNFSTFLCRRGLYVEDIYVEPNRRGRGYGKRLLARLADIAVEKQCGRMEWAVLDWNEPSIRFYESLGARPLSDWTTYRVEGDGIAAIARSGQPPV